jgi:sugar phosphate isomerase/epimerase
MITTAITDAGKDHAETIIKTAAGLGIRYAKLGYYRYGDLSQLHATLADVKARLRDVTAMCRNYGVLAGFHNHAGDTVGAALWDVWHLIHDLPADAIGSYFDIRHATVEGGEHGWRIGLSLLAPRIIMVAVKDFLWHKHAERGWRTENVPLGEGMVRGEEAFTRLKEVSFAGPISLHMEYMAGNQHTPAVGSAEDRANLASIRKDRETLMGLLRAAGLAPQGA